VLSKKSIPATISDETSGWKTYTNEKHSYQFRYPADWVIRGDFDGMRVSPRNDLTNNFFFGVSINGRSLSGIEKEFDTSIQNGNVRIKTNIFVDGIKAIQYSFEPNISNANDIFLTYDGKTYHLIFYDTDHSKEASSIFSTFKFIKKEPVIYSSSELTKEIALKELGTTCEKGGKEGEYVSCEMDIEKIGSYWKVTITHYGLYNDSVSASRLTINMTYQDGRWYKGESREEWACEKNRGHQGFSTELCF